jgi:hypothetical protein
MTGLEIHTLFMMHLAWKRHLFYFQIIKCCQNISSYCCRSVKVK